MYCPKCGKFYEYEGDVCKECEAAERQADFSDVSYAQSSNDYGSDLRYGGEPEPENRMYGFKKALASTIIGEIGFAFAYLAIMFIYSSVYDTYVQDTMLGLAIGFLIASVPLSIISLAQGIASIKCFKRRKATCAKNIPTLVLGINGTVMAGIAMFFIVFAMLLLPLVMMLI